MCDLTLIEELISHSLSFCRMRYQVSHTPIGLLQFGAKNKNKILVQK